MERREPHTDSRQIHSCGKYKNDAFRYYAEQLLAGSSMMGNMSRQLSVTKSCSRDVALAKSGHERFRLMAKR